MLLLRHPMSGQHVFEMIRSQPLVVDLLLTLLVKADCCEEPFDASGCPVVHRGITGVEPLINKLPPLAELARMTSYASLADRLDDIDRRLFPLLRWLLVYQPVPLRCVDKADHIPLPGCIHQFAVDQPATVPASFADSLALGFHGSPAFNWHSILRHGLRSGQLPGTGRAGAALWVAADIATSASYTNVERQRRWVPTTGWKHSVLTNGWVCVAVVDVASWEAQQPLREQRYHVKHDERAVSIRALLLLDTAAGLRTELEVEVGTIAAKLVAWRTSS